MQKIIDALDHYDGTSRAVRAKRIEWVASLNSPGGIILGELVPLSLIEEARIAFVNGLFLATVLCAAAVVEHLLVEELETQGGSRIKKGTMGDSIEKAKEAQLYPDSMLADLRKLNNLRNPVAHRRKSTDESTLVNRFQTQKIHPDTIKEQDASLALKIMYEYFSFTLIPTTQRNSK